MYNLKKPAGNHQILEKMDERILVNKIAVEEYCGHNAPDSEYQSDRTRAIADQQKKAEPNFNRYRHGKTKRRKGEPCSRNSSGYTAISAEFACAAHDENAADE
jgi:hypothetical protein